jgi:hypothetical protein
MAMYNAAILASQNEQLIAENNRQKQKRAKKHQYIAKGGVFSREEAQAKISEIDNSQIEVKIGNTDEPRPRAPPKCSLCTLLEHKANKCPQRQGPV